MARSHVVQYFLEVENQYIEMAENLKEMQQLAAENKISADDYEQILREVEIIKSNYERIGYIMFLLNKPQRKGKKLDKTTLSWYEALKTSSKEAILDENRDALCTLKALIKEGKLDEK